MRHYSFLRVPLLPILLCGALISQAPALSSAEDGNHNDTETLYRQGKQAYTDQNYAQAYSILKPLAQIGHPNAQIFLAVMYEYGHGTEIDQEESFRWYQRAARQGRAEAQSELGSKYFQGSGVAQDPRQAMAWWEKAAQMGYARAQYNLGLLYFHGLDGLVEKDLQQAMQWFSQAAEKNHPNAQYSLGVMYTFGDVVPQDYERAFALFQDAAAQDLMKAQYNLGILYENGLGVTQDPDMAEYWFQQAASQGLPEAQKYLAQDTDQDTPTTSPGITVDQSSISGTTKDTDPGPLPDYLVQEPQQPKHEATAIATSGQDATTTLPAATTKPQQAPMPDTLTRVQTVATDAAANFIHAPRPIPRKSASSRTVVTTPPTTGIPPASTRRTRAQIAADARDDTVYPHDRTRWMQEQEPAYFTIQINSLGSRDATLRYIANANLTGEIGYVRARIGNAVRYNTIFGVYADRNQAALAMQRLPAVSGGTKPWVRNIGQLQPLLQGEPLPEVRP